MLLRKNPEKMTVEEQIAYLVQTTPKPVFMVRCSSSRCPLLGQHSPALGTKFACAVAACLFLTGTAQAKELVIVPLGWDCEHVGQQLRPCARVP
jgi:hypothetical protein